MIGECINWIKRSKDLADEYYRAMTAWATSPRTNGSVKPLVKLASTYKKALDRAMSCLRKLRPSREVEIEIAKTRNYRSLVINDISLLDKIKE